MKRRDFLEKGGIGLLWLAGLGSCIDDSGGLICRANGKWNSFDCGDGRMCYEGDDGTVSCRGTNFFQRTWRRFTNWF